jgi:hypothetical protein
MVFGSLVFEFFTAPMWLNLHLGNWAYMNHSVSWILTLGLASLSLSGVVLVDSLFPKLKEAPRYFLSIALLWPLLVAVEKVAVILNIRGYAPETAAAFTSTVVPGIGMPWLGILYFPLLFAMLVAFYKYFAFYVDKKPILPMRKGKVIRNLFITLTGVLLFELIVGAMVENVGFPSWSYIWRDITIVLSGGWVLVIVASTWFVDRFFIQKNLLERFVLYLTFATVFITPFEAWFIHTGHRVYSPSTVANFSGFVVPWLNIPLEVIFAVPFYLALVVGFARYWEIILDNAF